jgi:hypothetical protein
VQACSLGRSQILGENHLLAGYATPVDMVADFCADEDNHIEAMVRFVKGKKLDVHLRRIDKLGRPSTPSDWIPVASGYNGSGFATDNYHGRLADRHNWWRGKPDTPWNPADKQASVVLSSTPVEVVPTPIEPPPAVIVSDVPIAKPSFLARFFAALIKRTSA